MTDYDKASANGSEATVNSRQTKLFLSSRDPLTDRDLEKLEHICGDVEKAEIYFGHLGEKRIAKRVGKAQIKLIDAIMVARKEDVIREADLKRYCLFNAHLKSVLGNERYMTEQQAAEANRQSQALSDRNSIWVLSDHQSALSYRWEYLPTLPQGIGKMKKLCGDLERAQIYFDLYGWKEIAKLVGRAKVHLRDAALMAEKRGVVLL